MGMNKKGFFFTTAAIALSIIIVISYNVYTGSRPSSKIDSTEIRIDTMNAFIKDSENDLEKAIFIVGFRSLLSLEDYMMKHDKFFNEIDTPALDDAFKEVFLNGTIDSEKMELMWNNTFSNWTNKMKVLSNKTDILVNFSINDVTITQTEPWMVDILLDLNIEVEDKKGTASWTINKIFSNKINITGFEDPLYLVNNNGLVNNTIRKTTVDPTSSTANLETHMLGSYYLEHPDAPSYLMRFENNLASSSNGIESLVNSQKLIDESLPINAKSAVDYIYFDSGNNPSDCNIEDLEAYGWFYLDYLPDPPNHMGYYNAECDT